MSVVQIWAHQCDACGIIAYRAPPATLTSEPAPAVPDTWGKLCGARFELHFCSLCVSKMLTELENP